MLAQTKARKDTDTQTHSHTDIDMKTSRCTESRTHVSEFGKGVTRTQHVPGVGKPLDVLLQADVGEEEYERGLGV